MSVKTMALFAVAAIIFGAGLFAGRHWAFDSVSRRDSLTRTREVTRQAATPSNTTPSSTTHRAGSGADHRQGLVTGATAASDRETRSSATYPNALDSEPDDHEDDHAHDHEDVVELTRQAYQNLGLQEQTVELTDYWRTLRIPAFVIEKPGHSSHIVAAPVNGIVQRSIASVGQAVSPGDDLMTLRVIDEELSNAQLNLLQDVTRLEVIATELERLAPLIADGTVPGRQQRALVYEKRQLTAKRQLHEQELLVRGLEPEQVADILSSHELVRDFTVRLIASDGDGAEGIGPAYTVEKLVAMPGMAVQRGEDLCELAYHAELFVKGQAFENELDLISNAADRKWGIDAEFGIQNQTYERHDLSIEYIDNHVDDKSQTFALYVPIKNEVVRDYVNDRGVRFRGWRFKPGQRAHLKVPIEHWKDRIVLPIGAVVEDGLDLFVFRRHVDHGPLHDDADSDTPHDDDFDPREDDDEAGEAHDDHFAEFERVPVRVMYRGVSDVVIETDGSLNVGDKIAVNRAYEMNLALKRMADGGGGHHHHDH